MTSAKKVWERALKHELGPTLTWLLDEMQGARFQSESSDFFLLDPPTAERLTSTAQQTKLGLFVLGRTAQGLFGVERTGDAPLDARPVFTAAFKGTERTQAARNLDQFLRSLKGFDAFVAKHASKPMPSASTTDTAKAPAAPSKPIKLAKAKAVLLAREQLLVALRPVSLLVYEDEVASNAANTLDVTLAINLPDSLADALGDHAFLQRVAEMVRAQLSRATGYQVNVHFIFDPLDTGAADHVSHLAAMVKKSGDASAEAFMSAALRAR